MDPGPRMVFTVVLLATPLAIGVFVFLLLAATGSWATIGMFFAAVLSVAGIAGWLFLWMLARGMRNWDF